MDRAPEGALRLLTPELHEIVPSLTNPRRRRGLDIDSLTAFAADLRQNGLINPITIRTLPAGRLQDTADMSPRPGYELIAGERRYRAAQIAEFATIPALLRDDLTQEQVEQMQLVENVEREDLDPLEEADAFARLRSKFGYTALQIATKIAPGKGESYVLKRTKLADLTEPARDAMYETPPLDVSTALLIARYRPEQQADVLGYVRNMKAGGEWPSFRQVQPALAKAFHLVLAHAPFDIASADLVPAAGACTNCPHHSANQGDIFGDTHAQDSCTNTGCFQQKREAHAAAMKAQLEEDGITVVPDDEARKATSGAKDVLVGFKRVDDFAYVEKGKDGVEREVTFGDALRKLGKRAPKPLAFIHPDSLQTSRVIPVELALTLLPREADDDTPPASERGKKKPKPAANEGVAPRTTPEEDAITNRDVERAVLIRIFDAIRTGPRSIWEMQQVARSLFALANHSDMLTSRTEEYLGWSADLDDKENDEALRIIDGKLAALGAEDLSQVMAMAAVEITFNTYGTTDAQQLAIAQAYHVDVLAVRDKVAEDLARTDRARGTSDNAIHPAQLERLIDKAIDAVNVAEAVSGKKRPTFATLTAMRNEMNALRDAQADLRAGNTDEAMNELRELAGVGDFEGQGWATIVGDELRELLQPAKAEA